MHNFYKSIDRYTCFPETDLVASVDTETTGSYLHHNDRMFFLSITLNKSVILHPRLVDSAGRPIVGNVFSWEWDVDPITRQPEIPESDLIVIGEILERKDIIWVMHNAIFDVGVLCKEIDFDPIKLLTRTHDTMLMSHAHNSFESHGAKDLGVKYLGIRDVDQSELKVACNQARAVGATLGWRIASKETLPMYGRAPKVGWWVVDMWTPRAVAKYRDYESTHPWWSQCSVYGNTDTLRGLGLFIGFKRALHKEGLWNAYMENRTSLIPCFSMEYKGLHVHKKRAAKLAAKFDQARQLIEKPLAASIRQRFFRPNSVDSIRKVLYSDFQLPVVFTTKKGNPSTGKDVLTDLIKRFGPDSVSVKLKGPETFRPPMQQIGVESYSQYRLRLDNWSRNLSEPEQLLHFCSALMMWKKLRSSSRTIDSYLTKLLDGHLFPRYNPTGTKTIRLSSSDPNGQNISKGKLAFIEFLFSYSLSLRKLFGPQLGHEWWSIDYQQLQLRVFAALANDQRMLEAFARGENFHTMMAKVIFNTEDPDDAQRTIAKNVNFGFVFGAQPAKIEKTAHMPGLWDRLCRQFPSATSFMEQTSREVLRNGFVELCGYRLYVPDDKPYAGVNYKVQGLEGMIVKRAMIGVYDYLQQHSRPVNLICNVHDELVFEGKAGLGYKHMHAICSIMEDAGKSLGIDSPVAADYINDSWGDGHEVVWKDNLPFVKDDVVCKRMLGLPLSTYCSPVKNVV